MNIQNLYPGSWGSNCYLLTSGTHAFVVDPSAKAETILAAAEQSAGITTVFLKLILPLKYLNKNTKFKTHIRRSQRYVPIGAPKMFIFLFPIRIKEIIIFTIHPAAIEIKGFAACLYA